MSDTRPLQVRTIRIEAAESGPSELLVTARLEDERPRGARWFGGEAPAVIHRMTVRMRVRCPDLTITAIEGGMAAHPYTICPEAVPPLQPLVGVSVARGFTRAVNERVGRAEGCAHLAAVVHAMGPVVKQAAGAAFGTARSVERAARDLWFVNTCQAWREGGPLHRLIQAGDEEGIRRLSAYAPGGGSRSPSSG
jgi:hypothetical protein